MLDSVGHGNCVLVLEQMLQDGELELQRNANGNWCSSEELELELRIVSRAGADALA